MDKSFSFLAKAIYLRLTVGLTILITLLLQTAIAAELPRVVWKTQVQDGSSGSIEVLANGNLVSSRGNHSYEMFNSVGKSLMVYPGERIENQEFRGITFLDDGSYVLLTAHTKNYTPGTPFVEMSYVSISGETHWSQMLPARLSKVDSIETVPDGILVTSTRYAMDDRGVRTTYTQLNCFNLDGKELWANEIDWVGPTYNMVRLENGNVLMPNGGNLRCYNQQGKLLWEHRSWGVRLGFSVFPDGSSYALLKAPERLVKVNSQGQVAWECNLTDYAKDELNSYYDEGRGIWGFVTVDNDNTVYVCDPYNALTAIDSEGKHLWSIVEPRPPSVDDFDWELMMNFFRHPSVAPDGTIYLVSRLGNLMAVNPEGEIQYVDTRFTDIHSAAHYDSDGKVFIGAAGWIYALKPDEKAVQQSFAEQEAVYEAERLRDAEWEAEFAEERELMEQELATIEEDGGDPDAYLEELYGGWSPDSPAIPGGAEIADRTVVAAVIVGAMLEYYEDKGEFPPFLLGVKHAEDPLIAGGYLQGYPLVWPQPGCWCCMSPANTDDTQHVRWSCAVSTPGEPALPINREGRGINYSQTSNRKRQNCLSITPGMHDTSGWSYFGYQRGEWLGRSEQEAWLWFYGSNIWPEQNNPISLRGAWNAPEYFDLFQDFSEFGPKGFDLLNGETGDLIPDGTPDGICLLYKLSNGKLVEVIRADGI